MNLLQRTYELMGRTDLSQREVAAGAGVGREWFAKFSQRKIKSPGAPRVQAVHDFLVKKSARVRAHAA